MHISLKLNHNNFNMLYLFIYFYDVFLRHYLTQPRLTLNWEWSWIPDPPISLSEVWGLQSYIIL